MLVTIVRNNLIEISANNVQGVSIFDYVKNHNTSNEK
jgi:hypothetical protein